MTNVTPSAAVTVPSAGEVLRDRGRLAGVGAVVAGLSHLVFALGGVLLGLGITELMNYTYPADRVLDYRWYGIGTSLVAMIFAVGYPFGMLALGRLAWRTGSFGSTLATVASAAWGTLTALAAGLSLALTSGATADLTLSGADVPAQQVAMQAAWIIIHGAWYAATWIGVAWLVAFAIGAYRTGVLRVLGVVLTFVAAATAVAIVVVTPYPTSFPIVSLYLLVLGIVLLVRTRRAAVETA